MQIETTSIDGALVIQPDVHEDERGLFLETYSERRYRQEGITETFVQDNHSRSAKNTLRGLHYQKYPGQAKLVRVTRGEVLDVAVDIRPDSPTCGKWLAVRLSADNFRQLYLPVGFAHGFAVITDMAEVQYKCSSHYDPDAERTIAWDDPDLSIDWGISEPVLSDRDRNGTSFKEYLAGVQG